MQKLLVTATLLMLTIGPAAVAQTDNSSSRKGPMPAPVGHRQPRADQVPQEKDTSGATEAEKRQDAELDRKIKSICRGC
jgi:hypothetical protein